MHGVPGEYDADRGTDHDRGKEIEQHGLENHRSSYR
jgi:hypothetical protein